MLVTERRFKENSGVQFTPGGKIRCQALAKSRIKKWREEFDDYELDSDHLWPECQCNQPAATGYYVCRWHGGETPTTVSEPRTIIDVMPAELAAKFRVMMDDPDYISRKDDILLIKSRQWQLLESLQAEVGSEEAWSMVAEALVKIKRGDHVNGIDLLDRAVKTTNDSRQIWGEIYRSEKLLGDLTTTQVKTAKDLKILATYDQVSALMSNLLKVLIGGIESHIDDPVRALQLKQYVLDEVKQVSHSTALMQYVNNNG